jgi:hypothetical protein
LASEQLEQEILTGIKPNKPNIYADSYLVHFQISMGGHSWLSVEAVEEPLPALADRNLLGLPSSRGGYGEVLEFCMGEKEGAC